MSANKHGSEHVGANPRDHARPRRPFLKHAHKDWRVWVAALVLIALVLVYVMTNNLSLRSNGSAGQPMPAANAP
jgi:uncharacterized integral membrane protein